MTQSNQDSQSPSKSQTSVDGFWRPFPDCKGISAGISTLESGVVAWGRGPDAEVAANRIRFLEQRGLDAARGVAADQVHGNSVHVVIPGDAERGIREPETRIPRTDGLVTDVPGLILVTAHADCAPVFLLDEKRRAIGLLHAGWRGILAGVIESGLAVLSSEFESSKSDVRAAIGPTISPERYEVSRDLADQFRERIGGEVVLERDGSPHLDLYLCIRLILERQGVIAGSISDRPPCTFDSRRFSSYRRDQDHTTGMITFFTIL